MAVPERLLDRVLMIFANIHLRSIDPNPQRRYAQAPPRAREQTNALGGKAGVHHLYRRPAMLESALATLLRNAQLKASPHITAIDAELVMRKHALLMLFAAAAHWLC